MLSEPIFVWRQIVPVVMLDPPPSIGCELSLIFTDVVPLGRLTLVVVTVDAMAEPADKASIMPVMLRTDFNPKTADFVILTSLQPNTSIAAQVHAGCMPDLYPLDLDQIF